MIRHYSRAQLHEDAKLLDLDVKAGFTEAIIKDRRGELMQTHHPDRGGNMMTAQDINAASDRLIDWIERRIARRRKISKALQAGAGLLFLIGSAGLMAIKKGGGNRPDKFG